MSIFAPVICVLLIIFDQVTKYFAAVKLKPIGSVNVVENFFALTYVENQGAAFGLLQGARWFFIVITIAVLAAIAVYYMKLPKNKGRVYIWLRAAVLLIMSGAAGNFIDRFRQGFVVDFFHAVFIDFPVFNVADVYLVTGTALFCLLVLFFVKEEKKEEAL